MIRVKISWPTELICVLARRLVTFQKEGIRISIKDQQPSGDLMTFFANYLFCMMALVYVLPSNECARDVSNLA